MYMYVCMHVYNIYILDRWRDREVVGGWDKENKDARNSSLYAFSFSHHIHMPMKWDTSKGLLSNKNHLWNIFQIINNVIICTFKITL